jgi:hypothetical protein
MLSQILIDYADVIRRSLKELANAGVGIASIAESHIDVLLITGKDRDMDSMQCQPTKCLCLVVSTCHLLGPSSLSDSCWVPFCLKPAQLVCSQHPDLDPWA